METEIEVMKKREVWHLSKLPANTIPVGCRWVFTLKHDEGGNIAKFKARLVAQGFKQEKGISYEETFSPVVNFSVVRFFFSLLVVLKKWVHLQCDVTSAYLYAPLKEDIFMSQPKGFEDPGNENLYCKLDRAIYGLCQSGREWYFEIHRVLTDLGFVKLDSCNCVYTFSTNVLLILYVDDMVIFGVSDIVINEILDKIKGHFEIKVLGRTRKLLGVEFDESTGIVEIHQRQYIEEVYKKFEKYKIPISSLPISKGSVYSKVNCPVTENEKSEMSQYPYRNILGCLSYIANKTRPDISYSVNIFSQFQVNPGMVHWCGLLRLLGYVNHTKHYKLKLDCQNLDLITYTDADFAANRDDRTSMGGQLVLLDTAPVDWRTFKEKSVTLSTMESEFVAMTEAAKNLVWFDRILSECSEKGFIEHRKSKPLLRVDNQAAIDFVKSPIENSRSKHIDIKLFFIRELVYYEKFNLVYVRSKANLADIFTKPLTKNDLLRFIENIFDACS